MLTTFSNSKMTISNEDKNVHVGIKNCCHVSVNDTIRFPIVTVGDYDKLAFKMEFDDDSKVEFLVVLHGPSIYKINGKLIIGLGPKVKYSFDNLAVELVMVDYVNDERGIPLDYTYTPYNEEWEVEFEFQSC